MPAFAFFKNEFMPLTEAKVGIMTHALHYGTSVFEGIRGNWNPEEGRMYLFRLREHYERLTRNCRVMKIKVPYTVDELCRITVELVQRAGFQEHVYVRPLAYKSSQVLGPRLHNLEDDFFVLVMAPGAYVDFEKGIKCCVSSWRRVSDDMIPPGAKIGGLYVNSCLAKTEANENGFDEAILLTVDGHVSEGTGENIFLVVNSRLVTPPTSDSILKGITRDTVVRLARDEIGLETLERTIDRGELYTSDECFMTGTLAHVTPVVEIDRRPVGNGEIGEVTRQIQDVYFDIITGKNKKYAHWCTPA